MSDFKKQYDKELKYQEEKSNKYTLNGVVMLIAVELIVWALNTIGIFEIDRRTITVAVIISIICVLFCHIMQYFCMSFHYYLQLITDRKRYYGLHHLLIQFRYF